MFQKPVDTGSTTKLSLPQVTTNQFIAVEPGLKRYWTNTGENTLKLLVIKSLLD